MTSTRAAVAILGLLLAACSGGPAPAPSPASTDPGRPLPSPVPEIVARVNGQPIRIAQILPIAKAELDKVSLTERDRKKPEVLRRALDQYVDRELLLQEALARGVQADSSLVDWAYDQMRREHTDEKAWAEFLAEQGMEPQSFKAELRAQHTVAALVAQEVRAFPVPEAVARAAFEADPEAFGPEGAKAPPEFDAVRAEVEDAVRQGQRTSIHDALLARLRGKARIELLL
ncbi:MAG TPA: SurA N-terminal domain-containing protein [Vicinamibacteria bacterium]|nr:SurA N-terminal domain-containing protein [Vicinamibacteria bacterium]